MAMIRKATRRIMRLANRHPWVIPLFGFVSGVISFVLVERKQEQFAQIISIVMLAGWAWLALEDLLQRAISRWFNIKVPPIMLRYVTQLVHQESLFFVIPFFFITTAWNSGQMVFTTLLIIAALISIIDPIYYKWLAPRRWLYFIFHGVTLFSVLLTALPLIFHLPTAQSYLWALGVSVLLSLPGIAQSMTLGWLKKIPVLVLLALLSCGIGYLVRPWIPPASLWLTQVAITDHIEGGSRSPQQKLKTVSSDQLRKGIYAYTAIHAPRGLNERIYHLWRYNGKDFDKIALDIRGGREQGYRAWSHKTNFPAQATGHWQIYVMTEANQVIGILRFEVVDAITKTKTKTSDKPVKEISTSKPAPEIRKESSEAAQSKASAQAEKTSTSN